MKKSIILLVGLLLLNTMLGMLSSCDDCNPNPTSINLKSITSTFKIIKGNELNSNNQLVYILSEDTISNSGIKFDSLGIDIIADYNSFSYTPNHNWNNAAYACEPAMDFSLLDSLIITSNSDYNINFPAGSNLASLVKIRAGYSVNSYPIYELLDQNYFINFIQAPSQTSIHQFNVSLKLMDGRIINSTLPNILIKN